MNISSGQFGVITGTSGSDFGGNRTGAGLYAIAVLAIVLIQAYSLDED